MSRRFARFIGLLAKTAGADFPIHSGTNRRQNEESRNFFVRQGTNPRHICAL